MKKQDVIKSLESIYLDYYDGLYTEAQLKFMLNELHKQTAFSISEWSEMILDAQWKYATEEDYEIKRQQLAKNEE